jgi:Ca2+:H+ antiporter
VNAAKTPATVISTGMRTPMKNESWPSRFSWLDALLVAVPIGCLLWYFEAPPVYTFILSAIAIIPLAGLVGRATEELADALGEGIGGLLNATFGNAAELIIGLVMLRQGPAMYSLIKASLTGSIVGNILLVLGMAMVAGGFRRERQVFNRTAVSIGATMLALATIGLIMPAIYFRLLGAARINGPGQMRINHLSDEIAVVLAGVYLLSLLFTLRTHRFLFTRTSETTESKGEKKLPARSRLITALVLLIATVGIAGMSEILVDAVRPAAAAMKMNSVFIGVIVIAVIGNAAEHSTAIMMAAKDKMDLAMHIAVGSSIQVALFIAPVLVFASMLLGNKPSLDLHFSMIETVAVIVAVTVLAMVSRDGECNWMEGVLLLAVYLILALAMYNLPEPTSVMP